MTEPVISYPFGEMDVQSPVYVATIALSIKNQKTLVVVGELTGNLALSAVAAADLRKGAELIIKLVSDTSARTVTLGAGFETAHVQSIFGTKYAIFVYNGTSFAQSSIVEEYADIQTLDYAATLAVTLSKQKTIVNVAEMSGAMTVNLTIGAGVKAGAELVMKLKSDATGRTVTQGTGMTGVAIAGVNSKTKYATFIYDGTTFVHVATQQVD